MGPEVYLSRRQAAVARLSELGADFLLLASPPDIRYLTGFRGEESELLLSEDGGAWIVTDGRYAEEARADAAGVEVLVFSGGDERLGLFQDLLPGDARLGVQAEALSWTRVRQLEEALPGRVLLPVERPLSPLRARKDREEVALIERAARLAEGVFLEVLGEVKEGLAELDLAAEMEYRLRKAGAEGPAFPVIVAAGPSSSRPHHRPGARRLARGEPILVDMGAVLGGYHSDMTRLFCLGRPPEEVVGVHRAVVDALNEAAASLKAGEACQEVDRRARSSLAARGLAEAFTHGTGHGVGLEIHEAPTLRKDSADILAAGSVVTVEPGVYFPGSFGVRVEDLFVVGEGGAERVTSLPREVVVL